ncbi:MAG: hypothetical protein HRU12_11295 [Phaeodactylibacter sp.]|nr:hypothetical protein [Phaeodactylibacter sp.]
MNKRQFVKHIKELLALDDFKAVGVGAGAVSIVRGNEEIIISYDKHPGQFILPPSLSAWKCFPSVEDILEKYFISNNVNYRRNTIHINSRRVEDLKIRTIETLEDFDGIIPELRKMVYDDILPFFEGNQTLEDVHSRVVKLEVDELANFIINPPHPRIMVIKRLVNACDWESYCIETIEMYKEQSEGKYKAVFEPIYRFLPDLYKELKQLDYPA